MFGDMTDEISGKGISSFVSTGPKSYSFKYGDDEQKSAIKGFTLNHENNNLLNHDSLSKIVKRQIREITIVNENKITRKNREIVNKYCEKYSNLVMTKGSSNMWTKITSTHFLMVTKVSILCGTTALRALPNQGEPCKVEKIVLVPPF